MRKIYILGSIFLTFIFALLISGCDNEKKVCDGKHRLELQEVIEPTYYNYGKKINLCKLCDTIVEEQRISKLYSDDFIYEYDEALDGYKVIYPDDQYVINAYIPAMYCGKPVVEIAEKAFSGCRNLVSVTITENIQKIGNLAFDNCPKLFEIYNVSKVSLNSYYERSSRGINTELVYTSLSYESNIQADEDGFAYGKMEDKYYLLACDEQENLVLPETLNGNLYSIYCYAFYNHLKMKSVIIPDTVENIGTGAFSGCSNLESISLSCIDIFAKIFGKEEYENSVSINAYNGTIYDTYYIPRKLTKVIVTGEVTIPRYAFYNCSNIKTLVLTEKVKFGSSDSFTNCYGLFEIYNLTTVVIKPGEEKISDIGKYAKVVHTSLEDESHLKQTEDGYWYGYDDNNNYYLIDYYQDSKEIILPDLLDGHQYSIKSCAFYKNKKIEKIVASNGIINIEEYAFAECTNIKEIVLSSSVENIGKNAFSGNKSLDTLYYNGTLDDWCSIKFENEYSTPMRFVKKFMIINEEGQYQELNEIVIPQNITEIGNYQFCNFNKITNIVIHDQVSSIGDNAFEGCISLKTINIPSSISYIGASAFYNDHLTNIYYDICVNEWVGIEFINLDANPLMHTEKLYVLNENMEYIEYSEVTSIIIKDGTTKIGNYQFYQFNNLVSVTIPSSISSIGYQAFKCLNLENVYYKGTMENWCNIEFVSNYNKLSYPFDASCNPMDCAEKLYMYNDLGEYEEVTEILIPRTIEELGDYQFYGFDNLVSIIIPRQLRIMGSEVFGECLNLTIYCEEKSKPSRWDYTWNPLERPIIWEYEIIQ